MPNHAMRIGLIADTHVPKALQHLPESLVRVFSGVECIVHAGDLVALPVLETLGAIAPTLAVAGNCDPPEVARQLPERATIRLDGCRIGVHHGHQRHALQILYVGRRYEAPEFDMFYQAMITQLPGCDVIVFGHFHAPVVQEWHGVLFVNPGSVAPPHLRPTCAVLEIGAQVSARVLLIDETGTKP